MCRCEELREIIRVKRRELNELMANDGISEEVLYAKSVEFDRDLAQMQKLLEAESE